MEDGSCGAYTGLFRSWLNDIMYGNEQHEWAHVVGEPEAEQCLR